MKGLSSRYGYVNVQRVTSEQLKDLDSGTLLITNKRLLFNGAKKNVSLPLKRIIHFTMYSDAIQIEKVSGAPIDCERTLHLDFVQVISWLALRAFRRLLVPRLTVFGLVWAVVALAFLSSTALSVGLGVFGTAAIWAAVAEWRASTSFTTLLRQRRATVSPSSDNKAR